MNTDALKFEKGEAVLFVAPRKTGRSTVLAQAYVKARKAGIKRIKVYRVCRQQLADFFDDLLPAADYTDIFAEADNAALKVEDAELVLIDDAEYMHNDEMRDIVAAVRKTKAPIVATANVLESDPHIPDAMRNSLLQLGTLKRRVERFDIKGKQIKT